MASARIDLSGKKALITGAASGIGEAVARYFSEMGAALALSDIDGGKLAAIAQTVGARAAITGDVSAEADADRMVGEAVARLDGLDILFNSAGIADIVPSLNHDFGLWKKIFDINLSGTFLMCRAAGRVMVPKRSGSIINVSSINGIRGFPRRAAYGASKAGVAAVTRALACEWGGSGVRVNAVAPGYIRTAMVDELERDGKIDLGRIEGRTPLGRLGLPIEIAHAAAFLASDLAAYVTGVLLPVDGGWDSFGASGEVATA
jgi:NAD(P)-dependent dehydrogenase (short-subunit alcohol dehydrogenase family)